jgi:hypothetical protein
LKVRVLPGEHGYPPVIVSAGVIDRWRPSLRDQEILAAYINPQLGAVPLRALAAADVRNWYGSTAISKPTMRAHAYGLYAICATAVDDELIPANPCRIKGAGSTTSKRAR